VFDSIGHGLENPKHSTPAQNELRKSGGGGATPVVPAIVEPKG